MAVVVTVTEAAIRTWISDTHLVSRFMACFGEAASAMKAVNCWRCGKKKVKQKNLGNYVNRVKTCIGAMDKKTLTLFKAAVGAERIRVSYVTSKNHHVTKTL